MDSSLFYSTSCVASPHSSMILTTRRSTHDDEEGNGVGILPLFDVFEQKGNDCGENSGEAQAWRTGWSPSDSLTDLPSINSEHPPSLNLNDTPRGLCSLKTARIVEVISGVFLGPYRLFCDPAMTNGLNLSAMVCVAKELPDHPPTSLEHTLFVKVPLVDGPSQSLAEAAGVVIREVTHHRDAGRAVGIYCRAGQSRSVAMLIAYIMHVEDGVRCASDILAEIKQTYPAAECNPFFLMQLDEELRGCK